MTTLTDIIIPTESLTFSGDLLEDLPVISKNFFIGRGEDFSYDFILKTINRNILNLIGCSVSTKFAHTDLYVTSNIITSTVENLVGGKITLSLTNVETAILNIGRYSYSCFLITPLGKRIKIMGGIITIYATYL